MLGQDRGGDGPNPAGHGCNSPRGPDGALEVHISLESAPGAKKPASTNPLWPAAATRISACRHTAGRSAVLEWHMVTVAFRLCNSIDTGLPITRLRPMTAARLPAGSQP